MVSGCHISGSGAVSTMSTSPATSSISNAATVLYKTGTTVSRIPTSEFCRKSHGHKSSKTKQISMFQPRKIWRGSEKIRAGPIGSVGGPTTIVIDQTFLRPEGRRRKGSGYARLRIMARCLIVGRRGTPYVLPLLGLALLVLTNFQEICCNGMLSRCSYI